jgi:CheY-like chemotaxis protein
MTQSQSRKKILMVDDQLDYIQPYAEALQDEDYDVTLIPQVDQALELLRSSDFDVIILDMLMPPSETVHDDFEELDLRKSGGWVLSQIRAEERLRTLPVIFITAVRDPQVRQWVEETEKAYTGQDPIILTKPVTLHTLIKKVRRVLE